MTYSEIFINKKAMYSAAWEKVGNNAQLTVSLHNSLHWSVCSWTGARQSLSSTRKLSSSS